MTDGEVISYLEGLGKDGTTGRIEFGLFVELCRYASSRKSSGSRKKKDELMTTVIYET